MGLWFDYHPQLMAWSHYCLPAMVQSDYYPGKMVATRFGCDQVKLVASGYDPWVDRFDYDLVQIPTSCKASLGWRRRMRDLALG